MAMKFALITLLCFGAALATRPGIEEWEWLNTVSSNRKIEDQAFRSGREYQFFYNGQLATGVAGASKQHSANRIQALVTVAIKSESNVILRLHNVRLGKMNRLIPNPRKIMPFDAFEDTPIEQHLKEKLEKPVKFSYEKGLVKDVEFDSREDPWSANVKRGVLNLLQVNLQQQRKIESPEESILTNSRRNAIEDEVNQPIFYRVMEETLEGECETLYTIQQQGERRSSVPALNITKSINFEKCNKRPQIKYNFRFAAKCPSCDPKYEDEEKFLKSSTVVQYNVTGTKDSFLIDSARTESQYVFTPFDEEANVIVTYVNQTLVLIKTGPIQSHPELQNPIKSDSNMLFTLDWDIALEKSSMHGPSDWTRRLLHQNGQRSDATNKVEIVKKIIQKMSIEMKEQIDEDLPRLFSHLISWLRQCDQQELEQIVRMQEPGQLSPEEEKKIKSFLPQALGSCATKECVKILVQQIKQGHIHPLRAAVAIKSLVNARVVSKDIIQEVIQLAESEKSRESEPLRRASWLIAGSMINALCSENEDQLALEIKEDAKKLCTRETKDTYVKLLFNKFRTATKWQDKVLMMKTIGNAGLDLSIFELEKVIRQVDSTQYPMYVRLEAIFALRELKDDMPKKIQRILMPVVMNRREYPTIRTAASYILLQTMPERPVLDQLARSLINEPSRHFASFVYTQLESYANSTNPCEQQFAADSKLALRQAKRVATGWGYSKLSHSTFQCPLLKYGVGLDFGALYSNVSAIPRHMGVQLHANGLGYWHKYLASLTLFNEGLEPLIREFYNERGLFSFFKSMSKSNSPMSPNTLSDLLQRRHPRSVGSPSNERQEYNEYEQELDDIFSKHLKIKHRQYNDEYENEPKAYFSAMVKSQTMWFLPMSKEWMQQLIREFPTKISEFLPKLQRGLPVDFAAVAQLHDMHLKVPTTLGFPLAITIDAPMAFSLKGKIQANLESMTTKSIKVQTELKPSAVATFTCRVEAWSPISVTGVKIQAKAKMFSPIDLKLEIELGQSPQIRAVIKPPTQKRDLLVVESRPVTYTRSWQNYVHNVVDESHTDEQTIAGEELNRVSTFNKCYGRQTLGVDVCLRTSVQSRVQRSPSGTPYSLFAGQNKLVLTTQPSESNQDIQIKINAKSQRMNGQEVHRPSFNILGRQSPFDNEDDSDSTSEEISTEQTASQEQHSHRRTTPQQQSRRPSQDPFQQYRQYEVKNGYKTQIQVELQAGSQSKISMEYQHLIDLRQRYGKVNMKMHRLHPDSFQTCFDAEMMYPEEPNFVHEVKEKKVLAHAKLSWGRTCDERNFVQITTQAERSRQQMQWEREQSEYKQYTQKQQCKQNKGWCSPLAQEDFLEKIGHMLKYRMDIDYQNVPPTLKNVTNKLYRALKHYYFWQTDVDQIQVQNPENKIRAEFVLDAQTKQRLNVTIKTPKENIMIQDLPLSRPVMVLNQKQPLREQFRDYLNNEDETDDQAQCSITGKSGWQRRSQVETFDGAKFSAPFSNCWVVLSKDCGSSKPEFVVMARKSEKSTGGQDLKDVKIVTRTHRIELMPESDEYESIKVKVNGKSYDPEIDQDVVEHGHLIAKVDKEGSTINVQLPEAGVEVEFDGYAINVKLAQYYQGQQCGLCGHFDQESVDEFRNPDFSEEQDLRQYYMNYLIKDGRCQVPQLSEVCEKENCDQDKSSSSSSSSSSDEDDNDNDETTEKPDHKTKVIEMDDQLCFSTIPVPQCDENSYAVEVKERKAVPYTCIDQDNESAEQYQRRARLGKKALVQGLVNRQPTFTRTESIPEKCQKYKS